MVRMLDHGFCDCPLIVTKNPGWQVSVSAEVDLKVEMWRGWWHFVLFPHEQCLSDFNLTRREGRLQFEKRHQAKWCPWEAEEQNESSFWAWGWGKAIEGEEESSDVMSPHSLLSLPTRSSPNTAFCLVASRLTHSVPTIGGTIPISEKCVASSHGILPYLCCFLWTCMWPFLFILLNFKTLRWPNVCLNHSLPQATITFSI